MTSSVSDYIVPGLGKRLTFTWTRLTRIHRIVLNRMHWGRLTHVGLAYTQSVRVTGLTVGSTRFCLSGSILNLIGPILLTQLDLLMGG